MADLFQSTLWVWFSRNRSLCLMSLILITFQTVSLLKYLPKGSVTTDPDVTVIIALDYHEPCPHKMSYLPNKHYLLWGLINWSLHHISPSLGLTNFPYSILTELLLCDIPKQQDRLHGFEWGGSAYRMEGHSNAEGHESSWPLIFTQWAIMLQGMPTTSYMPEGNYIPSMGLCFLICEMGKSDSIRLAI